MNCLSICSSCCYCQSYELANLVKTLKIALLLKLLIVSNTTECVERLLRVVGITDCHTV